MAYIEQTNTPAKQNEFLAQLYKFHEQNGTPIKRVPVVGGEVVDMYKLYNQVTEMGGFSKVTKDKQWNEIAQLFYEKHDVLNAGYLLKQHYIRFLMKYELTKKGGIQTKPLKSSDVYPHTPVVTPLNKYKILQLNNVQAPSPPTVETARASTTRREFINNSIMRPSLMHQDFEPAYYKLSMSLKSGLPNEIDFAFNTLTVLSCDESNPLLLSSVPSLLDLMLAHVGIYDEFDSGFQALYQTWAKVNYDLDYPRFWHSCVPNNVWSALMAVEHPGKFHESQELFHSYCGIGESTIESYRVAQVSSILRNLSLEKKNVIILGENKLLLSFVVLCMNCYLPSVMRAGYEIAVNIASVLRISKRAENVCSHLFIDTVVSAITGGDRLEVIRGMEILGELAWCMDNAELLAELPDDVYERIIFCTLVPDVEMLHCCFETLYSLSSLDQEVTDRIINIPNSMRLLVQFLTFKSEVFEQNAINKMEIELPSSDVTKQASYAITQGTPCTTNGITSLTVSPAQPLASRISQAQPITSIKAQPERLLSLAKPITGDGSFVSKWLRSHYEEVRGGMLSRTDLMQDFQSFCAKSGRTSGYTLMQLLRLVKMVFPSSYTRRIFDSNDVPQYVIGGIRKKMNIEWNFPPKPATAKSLPATPINLLPNNLRQLSSNSITNDHKKIIPKSLNGKNMTVSSTTLYNKASVLSTRPLLPALVPASISQSPLHFNNAKLLNSQYKENLLSHSATKGSGFGPFPEGIHNLAHNKLLKAILPATSQIFARNGGNESKSSQCNGSTSSCSTNLTSAPAKTFTLNADQTNLLNLIGYRSEPIIATTQHQGHIDGNSSKVCCHWEDCKSYHDTHRDLFIHCVNQHLHGNVVKCKWQGCLFTANRPKPSLLRHIEVYHCNATGKRPDVPSTTSILLNLKAFPKIELEEESKFTRSVRLTASLILYNLLISSPRATKDLLQHEIELSTISLSGVDCAGIVAKCLFILHNHDD